MSDTNTPEKSKPRKRDLSSPEYLLDLKKQCGKILSPPTLNSTLELTESTDMALIDISDKYDSEDTSHFS